MLRIYLFGQKLDYLVMKLEILAKFQKGPIYGPIYVISLLLEDDV